jgi:hypothetical protein
MDYDPETSFERDLICEDDEAFQLSTENMESLKTVLHEVRHIRYYSGVQITTRKLSKYKWNLGLASKNQNPLASLTGGFFPSH